MDKEWINMKFDDISDNELWVIANPIMDNLMDGSTKVDHAQHCRERETPTCPLN